MSTLDRLDFLDESKTSVEDYFKLEKRFDKFSNIEHIDTLKNTLMTKIERFSGLIDNFLSDNKTMRECIRRFDEDMSMKANKGELITM